MRRKAREGRAEGGKCLHKVGRSPWRFPWYDTRIKLSCFSRQHGGSQGKGRGGGEGGYIERDILTEDIIRVSGSCRWKGPPPFTSQFSPFYWDVIAGGFMRSEHLRWTLYEIGYELRQVLWHMSKEFFHRSKSIYTCEHNVHVSN